MYIHNYRRNRFGLLDLISVVLTSRMEKPILYRQLKCPTHVVHLKLTYNILCHYSEFIRQQVDIGSGIILYERSHVIAMECFSSLGG